MKLRWPEEQKKRMVGIQAAVDFLGDKANRALVTKMYNVLRDNEKDAGA